MQTFVSGSRKGLRNQGVNAPGCTQDGKEWLKAALDPFHDTAIDVRGLPDEDNSRVVVQVIKKTLNLSAPAGTAGNWAAHIFTSPLIHPSVMRPGKPRYGTYVQTDTTQAFSLGSLDTIVTTISSGSPEIVLSSLNAHSWTTDVPAFFPTSGATTYSNPSAWSFLSATAGDNNITSGDSYMPQYASKQRLIAAGFEIHNTTADLYKQGTLTVSRVPSRQRLWDRPSVVGAGGIDLLVNAGTNEVAVPVPAQPFIVTSGPPATLAEALSYSGTKQWNAAEGVYVPLTQDTSSNHLEHGGIHQVAIVNSDVVATTDAEKNTGFFTPSHTYANSRKALYAQSFQYNQVAPFDVSSVILSGLSQQSTFVIEATFILEVSPHLFDPNLGSLIYSAQPSPKYDRAALELYQMVSRMLPPGVPVSMNPAGEFWEMIRSLISRAGPTVAGLLGMVPHPAAQAAAGVVSAASVAAKALKPKKTEGKEKPKK